MALRVVFTDDAIETLQSTARFIQNKWGVRQAEKFLDRAYRVVFLVSENPYMNKAFRSSDNTRVGLVSKQTSFIYRVQENEIIILFFWDNRQEPFFTD
jgi:plasmid stabilization system protein ParE